MVSPAAISGFTETTAEVAAKPLIKFRLEIPILYLSYA
ncbi:hypothetical protein C414_000010000 [Campylobacter jejuni subsp. jejuni 414]|nr:hypothetical protein C414_000010000 [Campylobacter jejuni subsp. jejuni 414]